jgi:hypothetical protein
VAMENLSFIELGFNPRTGQTGQTGKEAEKNYWLLIQVDFINRPRFITVAYKVKENQNFIELKLSIMTITNRWINVELIQIEVKLKYGVPFWLALKSCSKSFQSSLILW